MNRTFEGVSHQNPFSRDVLIIDENLTTTFLKPDRSQALKNHSPDGFNWGYAGSGPAQLALAILLEVTDDESTALRYYQEFKFQVIAAISSQETNWTMKESKIVEWLDTQRINAVVEEIIENMDATEIQTVRTTPKDDLVAFHNDWGRAIRNKYLWRDETLVRATGKEHADDAGMVVIQRVWERLQAGKKM